MNVIGACYRMSRDSDRSIGTSGFASYQYLGKSPRTNRPVTVPAHSTPRNHCHENDHLLSLNDFKIIDSANNEHELRILESLYICKEKPSLNIDQSVTPLSGLSLF